MKWLFSMMILTMSACTTVRPPASLEPSAGSKSTRTLGTSMISGDELKQTGRTELSAALRASSPIFH
jgi:hypothetical protein